MDNQQVLDLFVGHGMVDTALAQDILSEIESSGKEVGEILADYQVISSSDDIWPIIAQELGTQVIDLTNFEPPEALLGLVPAGMARLHGALPVSYDSEGISVCLTDPLNPQILEDLRFAIGQEVKLMVAPDYLVEQKINDLYGGQEKAMEDILSQLDGGLNFEGSEGSMEEEANSAPIMRYVDLVLFQAIREKASDIHFEPFENEFKIRYRVDGSLYEMAPPPKHLALPIISRVKVMSNMNIAERRIPQDGRIVKQIGEQHIDMRVSSLPTQYGESVVLRVLDRNSVNLNLTALGLPPHIHEYVIDTMNMPNGIFIVTGPTGAGKTTTLYAALREINKIETKILTAEDPVEYDVDGIIQIPTNEAIGLSFARVLRAFLRQDPDKILVGEMRDFETSQIAIQASLTGHLVLSTLHTNDASGAITRLVDMGSEPFLVAASLEGVLAQRLIRTICSECKSPYEPSQAILSQLGVSPHELGDKSFYTGKGCQKCAQSGYKGRGGLFELLNVTDPLRELIIERAPSVVIKQKAIELGMTTLEEVLKYT